MTTLNRVRASLHLDGVRTLLVDGTITTSDTSLISGAIDPRVYRFLLPDTFQERSRLFSRDYVFCFSPAYWQTPTPDDLTVSRQNKLRGLADMWVLLLERAPSQFPLTVSTGPNLGADAVMLVFNNADSYSRRVKYDRKRWLPISIEHDYLDSTGKQQVFRLTVRGFATAGGAQIPQVIEQTFRVGGAPDRIEFPTVLVNTGVSADDFRSR